MSHATLIVVPLFLAMYGAVRVTLIAHYYIAGGEQKHFDRFTEYLGFSPVGAGIFWFAIGVVVATIAVIIIRRIESSD